MANEKRSIQFIGGYAHEEFHEVYNGADYWRIAERPKIESWSLSAAAPSMYEYELNGDGSISKAENHAPMEIAMITHEYRRFWMIDRDGMNYEFFAWTQLSDGEAEALCIEAVMRIRAERNFM